MKLLKLIASIMNTCHDWIVNLVDGWGLGVNDKALHFIIIGIVGMILFAGVHVLFKYLSKHSIAAISFIYTFTVLVVIVFAIEIQQKLTGSGNMESADIAYGLCGFICAFIGFFLIKKVVDAIKKNFTDRKTAESEKELAYDEGETEVAPDAT